MKQIPCIISLLLLMFSYQANAQTAEEKQQNTKNRKKAPQTQTKSSEEITEIRSDENDKKKDNEPGTIEYSYDEREDETVGEESYSSGVNKIFQIPVLRSGLTLGADAINRSVENIMDSIFYSLLDQTLEHEITPTTKFAVTINRDLYPTQTGSYVVVDRMTLGPKYSQKIAEMGVIPIRLGAYGGFNVYDIYLRNDGMRLVEQEELPFWRVAVNNWFGILPLLTNILPPAFNPNEMYDPMRLVEVPFVFPLDPEDVFDMQIGSIRSYSITGGVSFPFEFGEYIGKKVKEELAKYEGITATLPYTLFKTGEHRINVLRRSKYIAWVGVTDVAHLGHQVGTNFGRILKILTKVTPLWGGLPLPFFPIDVEITQQQAKQFDQVYSFDLRNEAARAAYVQATRGNFELAHAKYLDQKEKKIDTGVEFQFIRDSNAIEFKVRNSRKYLIFGDNRDQLSSDAEIKIVDEKGTFYILEGKQDLQDEHWDMLTGQESIESNHIVEMKVKRISEKGDKDSKDYTYAFSTEDNNPMPVTLSFKFNDKYVDAKEYRDYIDLVRYFTRLPLKTVPRIPYRSAERLQYRRQEVALLNPEKSHFAIHVQPTHLGQLSATAAVRIDTNILNEILDKPDNRKWRGFAEGFGLIPEDWGNDESRYDLGYYLRWMMFAGAYPLRLLSIRFISADAIAEMNSAISALEQIKKLETPVEKLDAFEEFFESDHPLQLARAVMNLSDLKKVPRSVTFFAKPKGRAPGQVKDKFKSLNNRVFKSIPEFPPSGRYNLSKEKLNAFFPSDVRERRTKPVITKIKVSSKTLPKETIARETEKAHDMGHELEQEYLQKHVFAEFTSKNIDADQAVKVYLHFAHGGRVQVGRLVLSEDVFKLKPLTCTSQSDEEKLSTCDYSFYLTGPLSPIRNLILDNAVKFGGEFEVTVTLSREGEIWSDERVLNFEFSDGTLSKPVRSF